ncbi:UDP:flavonoid glycosyltransferase YjiC (YdhE family) [Microbacterium proteolyticum]|uniref:UDP:flavonoid glycosyltransferase YjiC (YdhE family) n=1 Tax=Microbacterium proteolyticum TaxID=1572644 RepID=A0A7W5CHC5_9MICO|nr:glycosyltransferase [Microbacterium proteolyticum]MBB3157275.1 UDP:flavonoid glycosyltransferase YjiC (YdhE family) [Microbacterium proteolyticum]
MTPSALLCSMPAIGHVGPLLVVAQELQRRGWRVRLLTGSRYQRMVEQAGILFLPLPAEADTLDGIGADERDRGLATINRGVERAFVDPAAPAATALEQILRDEPADVVLHDMTFLGVQTLFARPRSQRPLTVMCGIGPAGFSSRDTAPYGLGITPLRQPTLNRLRNGVLGVVAKTVLRPVHRSLDLFLAGVGAPPLNGAFFMDVLSRSDLLAQFTVQEFEYTRRDAPDALRFYGPMASAAAHPVGTPAWFDDLDPNLPLVHVTQGTVANTDYTEVIEPTLTALADLPVQVAVTTGGRDVETLPALPDNAFAASYLPYDDLLARTSVLVTNGGYGGLHHAMRHGVPIVIAGDSEDKVETSARVQHARVGVNLRTGRPTPDAIRAAVQRILADAGYAARARRVGDAIAVAPGAPGLVDDIQRLLAAR